MSIAKFCLQTPSALLLVACAAGPVQRIERDPAAFAALSAEQQARVREGAIGVGYDPTAVRLAYGEPDRIVERETAEGRSEVWLYYAIVPALAGSGYCTPAFPYYGPSFYCRSAAPSQYEEHTRVVFKDGRVVSVERAR